MPASTIRRLLRAACVAATFGALATTPVAAAEDDKRFGEEILEILREEGKISDDRYQELKKKEAEEAAARDDGWTIQYSNGLKFRKNDGTLKFDIGGRIQADFASIHPEGDLDRAVSGGDGEGVEFRRARFYMSGELEERIIWESQIDFAGGDVTLDDVYIGMKGLGFLGTAIVGHQKEPYSLEELTSSKYISFMERALPSVFDSARNFGLSFQNAILDQRMTWATGIFADSDSGGEFFSNQRDFNVMNRITGLPLYQDDGRWLIHLGFSGGYNFRNDVSVRFRQRPEVHLAQRTVDTGDFQSDGAVLIAAEAAGVFGPVHVSAEWKQSWHERGSDPRGGKNLTLYGAYVSAGWFITGENRPYKKSSGIWARVEPKNPFDPDNGKWGAFELASRYSTLNLNSHDLNGGKEQNVTVGLNWYLYSNVRLAANYVYADVRSTGDNILNPGGNPRPKEGGDIHAFQARAQIEF